jgi:toxin ParE1/3/4
MAYRLSRDAEMDLDEIWMHVAENSGAIEIDQRLIESITTRFDILSAYPELGRARDELREELRSHPVENYIIFYRIADDDVLILRVLYGRRDLGPLLRGQ